MIIIKTDAVSVTFSQESLDSIQRRRYFDFDTDDKSSYFFFLLSFEYLFLICTVEVAKNYKL
jgi:hypothetical protein